MKKDWIAREAAQVRRAAGGDGLAAACERLGILLLYRPMGTQAGACKGFFLYAHKVMSITINSDLSVRMQQIALAHEMGHALLHRQATELYAYHDRAPLSAIGVYESEANLFAAELLIDDDQVLYAMDAGLDLNQLAGILGTMPELLDYKLRMMQQRCPLLIAPMIASADFLK